MIEGLKAKAMMKAVAPMLKMVGLPDNFMELVSKVKITEFSTDKDEESLTLYGQVTVADKGSLDALDQLVGTMLPKLKELSESG